MTKARGPEHDKRRVPGIGATRYQLAKVRQDAQPKPKKGK